MADILLIDPRQSGISGDMLLAALTDFFDCHEFTNSILNTIATTIDSLYSVKCNYEVEKTTQSHLHGSYLNHSIDKDFKSLNVLQFKNNWLKLLQTLKVSKKVQEKIFNALNIIVEVEKNVHGKINSKLEDIHFHELNSIDTIIDISLVFLILEKFNFPEISGLPTAIGTGSITFSHGTFQQPAPAVAKLLEIYTYPFITVDQEFELTTPTGLTNLISVVDSHNFLQNFPSGKILHSGIGLGRRQMKNYPNFMKIWKISPENMKESNMHDSLLIIETHLDDVSGEILGSIIERYSNFEGIKDVSTYPLIMKKNRPGHCLRILLDPSIADTNLISKKIMLDTGTLGIRYFPVTRHKTVREIVQHKVFLENQEFSIRIKLSKLSDGQIVNIKPEYDDLKMLSEKLGYSIRELSQIIVESYKKEFKDN